MKRELWYSEEQEIKDLLMFRKVIKVKNDTMFLDNGIQLQIEPNEG